jgi:hypothetical protein
MRESSIGSALYYKPAYALQLLREEVLGKDRFDYAFRHYVSTWAYKHPTPWDFFNSMNNASGEDLGWFWKAWFLENYRLDQAVSKVTDDIGEGATITLVNKGQMAMPVTISYKLTNGKTGIIKLPVEIWNNTISFDVRIPEKGLVDTIVIDPDKKMPDIDYSNNTFTLIKR